MGHFFWARKIKPGDVVDVHFKKSLKVKALLIVTGFDKDEERSGNDRLLNGGLLEAKDKGDWESIQKLWICIFRLFMQHQQSCLNK